MSILELSQQNSAFKPAASKSEVTSNLFLQVYSFCYNLD